MRQVQPLLPRAGEVYFDSRSSERALRVSWHSEGGVVVLSLWTGAVCTGSFRMELQDVPSFIEILQSGLSGRLSEAG